MRVGGDFLSADVLKIIAGGSEDVEVTQHGFLETNDNDVLYYEGLRYKLPKWCADAQKDRPDRMDNPPAGKHYRRLCWSPIED